MIESILVAVLILGLIYTIIYYLPLPAPFKTIVNIVFAVFAIIILLRFL